MPDTSVDVLVIGAGPGGYPAAIRCGQLGLSTLIVDKGMWGGTCLNVGCIPSKALITAGKTAATIRKASVMGISTEGLSVDMGQMQEWKQSIVKKMSGGVKSLCKGNGATIDTGVAVFKSDHTALVTPTKGEPYTVTFQHAVIATGSVPIEIPGFEFDEETILSSTGALALAEAPGHVVVIGGGYIGLELGQMLRHLGVEITVVEMADQVLPGFDPEIVTVVSRKMKKAGIKTLLSARATGWKKGRAKKNPITVTVEGPNGSEDIRCDKVLVTVGRRPYTEGLDPAAAGVAVGDRGFIAIDEKLRTNVPHIYCVGDVSGNPMLAHRASMQGEIAAEVIAGKNVAADYKTVPSVVFTDPEIATAGLSEQEARDKGFDVEVGKFPWGANGRALTHLETDGFVKVITDKGDGQVLGVAIVGPHASDLISEAALAIEMDAYAEDIGLTIHPHPTLGEAVMEAANKALGHAIHIMN
ncbi:MAG: dihydrolipoyl dehydrogenase [Alphaproteobacteria bacterium]|nr:dihydrolipoyl dehydrogenase [Alphaproteobacteria bacterium]HCP47423.1 dihydrolipoyl dehydrogenase [Deltaproteobacteria bacterium]